MDIEIGSRLKGVRQEAHLTQRELARRAGVTNGTISLIEKNKLNPTVGALKKILDVIPMSLSEFFHEEGDKGEQIFFRASELLELSEGDVSIRQVGRNLDGRMLQICHERYKAGASSGHEHLQHEGEEGGVIIEGHIEITVDGQTRILGPGDAYYFRSDQPHRLRNAGKKDCVFVSVISPPSF